MTNTIKQINYLKALLERHGYANGPTYLDRTRLAELGAKTHVTDHFLRTLTREQTSALISRLSA